MTGEVAGVFALVDARFLPAAHAPKTTPVAAARNPRRVTLTTGQPTRGVYVTRRYRATESGMKTASSPPIHASECQNGLNVEPPTLSARMASTV